jgi:hypothetical protein
MTSHATQTRIPKALLSRAEKFADVCLKRIIPSLLRSVEDFDAAGSLLRVRCRQKIPFKSSAHRNNRVKKKAASKSEMLASCSKIVRGLLCVDSPGILS